MNLRIKNIFAKLSLVLVFLGLTACNKQIGSDNQSSQQIQTPDQDKLVKDFITSAKKFESVVDADHDAATKNLLDIFNKLTKASKEKVAAEAEHGSKKVIGWLVSNGIDQNIREMIEGFIAELDDAKIQEQLGATENPIVTAEKVVAGGKKAHDADEQNKVLAILIENSADVGAASALLTDAAHKLYVIENCQDVNILPIAKANEVGFKTWFAAKITVPDLAQIERAANGVKNDDALAKFTNNAILVALATKAKTDADSADDDSEVKVKEKVSDFLGDLGLGFFAAANILHEDVFSDAGANALTVFVDTIKDSNGFKNTKIQTLAKLVVAYLKPIVKVSKAWNSFAHSSVALIRDNSDGDVDEAGAKAILEIVPLNKNDVVAAFAQSDEKFVNTLAAFIDEEPDADNKKTKANAVATTGVDGEALIIKLAERAANAHTQRAFELFAQYKDGNALKNTLGIAGNVAGKNALAILFDRVALGAEEALYRSVWALGKATRYKVKPANASIRGHLKNIMIVLSSIGEQVELGNGLKASADSEEKAKESAADLYELGLTQAFNIAFGGVADTDVKKAAQNEVANLAMNAGHDAMVDFLQNKLGNANDKFNLQADWDGFDFGDGFVGPLHAAAAMKIGTGSEEDIQRVIEIIKSMSGDDRLAALREEVNGENLFDELQNANKDPAELCELSVDVDQLIESALDKANISLKEVKALMTRYIAESDEGKKKELATKKYNNETFLTALAKKRSDQDGVELLFGNALDYCEKSQVRETVDDTDNLSVLETLLNFADKGVHPVRDKVIARFIEFEMIPREGASDNHFRRFFKYMNGLGLILHLAVRDLGGRDLDELKDAGRQAFLKKVVGLIKVEFADNAQWDNFVKTDHHHGEGDVFSRVKAIDTIGVAKASVLLCMEEDVAKEELITAVADLTSDNNELKENVRAYVLKDGDEEAKKKANAKELAKQAVEGAETFLTLLAKRESDEHTAAIFAELAPLIDDVVVLNAGVGADVDERKSALQLLAGKAQADQGDADEWKASMISLLKSKADFAGKSNANELSNIFRTLSALERGLMDSWIDRWVSADPALGEIIATAFDGNISEDNISSINEHLIGNTLDEWKTGADANVKDKAKKTLASFNSAFLGLKYQEDPANVFGNGAGKVNIKIASDEVFDLNDSGDPANILVAYAKTKADLGDATQRGEVIAFAKTMQKHIVNPDGTDFGQADWETFIGSAADADSLIGLLTPHYVDENAAKAAVDWQ